MLAIPQELSDMILDFLYNDRAALRSAGRVCQSWLPASRFHLFSNISLDLSCNKGHRILEVICAESSTIPPYILHFCTTGAAIQLELLDKMLLRLPLLSNLKSLQLTQIKMANLTPDAKKKLTTMLQNLTSLGVYGFIFETVDQAIDFIASAPCLENIQFDGVVCSERCNYSSQAIAPPLRIIRFEPNPLVNNIMDWFCRCHPTPSVHTLVINRLTSTRNHVTTVCNFIRHLGSALENFKISCSNFDPIEGVWVEISEQIDLSQNISLRNIFFNDILPYADPPRPRNTCGWIISILSSIAHPSLETVTLTLFLNQVENIDTLELSTFDTLFLSQPLSNNSTKLCFRIHGNVDKKEAQAAVRNGLPKLDGKKRLEFYNGYDLYDIL